MKKNISDVDMNFLTLENLDFQFCSDFLKDEIRRIITERDEARAECAVIKARPIDENHLMGKLRFQFDELKAQLAAETAKVEKMSAVVHALKKATWSGYEGREITVDSRSWEAIEKVLASLEKETK